MRFDQVASAETNTVGGILVSKHAIWAGVSLIGVIIGCMTFLVYSGKDTSDILSVINVVVVPLLAALGYSKLRGIEEKANQVRENTNGNMSRVMDTLLARLPQESYPAQQADDGDGTVDRRRV